MELFSNEYMEAFSKAWNADEENMKKPLGAIHFTQKIAYGVVGEERPKGLLVVEDGVVQEARAVTPADDLSDLSWDLRAAPSWWAEAAKSPPGYTGLASAYMWGSLKFLKGSYTSMIKNPSMAPSFVHSFSLMPQV